MEIDITSFVNTAEPAEFSASQAELGRDAGKITWDNAKREAANSSFINEDSREAFERWAEEFGAWTTDEIQDWSLDECNALLIQFISGDLRELQDICPGVGDTDINWTRARELSERGTIGGRIYPGDDGRIYFYMGS